jgi:hypothetical protein
VVRGAGCGRYNKYDLPGHLEVALERARAGAGAGACARAGADARAGARARPSSSSSSTVELELARGLFGDDDNDDDIDVGGGGSGGGGGGLCGLLATTAVCLTASTMDEARRGVIKLTLRLGRCASFSVGVSEIFFFLYSF